MHVHIGLHVYEAFSSQFSHRKILKFQRDVMVVDACRIIYSPACQTVCWTSFATCAHLKMLKGGSQAVLLSSTRVSQPVAYNRREHGATRQGRQRLRTPVFMANFLSRLFGGGNSAAARSEVSETLCGRAYPRCDCALLNQSRLPLFGSILTV